MIKEKTVIPIDPDGRYIILVKDAEYQKVIELSEALKEWWKRDSKFFVLNMQDGIEITLERLNE